MHKQPILSLCIPIYNRITYLERQMERFLEDKDLFDDRIQLIISDNCSTDDLQSCCDKYKKIGIKLHYNRNATNLGPDGNFAYCFQHAEGKYVWLLGSDDIPVKGLLRKLLQYLESGDYGLIHLSMPPIKQELTCYTNSNDMALAVSFWITFMSANIIRTETLVKINLAEWMNSFMIQVPAYINAYCTCQNNAVIYLSEYFECGTDGINNGGYNLFQVFVTNLFGIYNSFVKKGSLSEITYEKLIKKEYCDFLWYHVIIQLVLRKNDRFPRNGAWKALWKYYGRKPYAYYYPFWGLIKVVLWKMKLINRI